MNNNQPLPSGIEDVIKDIRKRVSALENKTLGSFMLNGSITTYDANTGVKTVIGDLSGEGENRVGIKEWINDTIAPPVVTAPIVSSSPGIFSITWDGDTATGEPQAPDYDHLNVYGYSEGLMTLVGKVRLRDEVAIVANAKPGSSWQFYFKSVDKVGNESSLSEPSPLVTAEATIKFKEANAPTNLKHSIVSEFNDAGEEYGVVTLTWDEVVSAVDGSDAEVDVYDVWGSEDNGNTWKSLTSSITNSTKLTLNAGSVWIFKVRAAANGSLIAGPFSNEITVTVFKDTTPPPVPTKPTVDVNQGSFSVKWDGSLTGPTPKDFAFVDVMGSSNGGAATRVGVLRYSNETVIVPIAKTDNSTWEFWFVSQDKGGNRSNPSVKSTGHKAVDTRLDSKTPSVPTGVVGASTLTYTSSGDPAAMNKVSWTAVTTDTTTAPMIVKYYNVFKKVNGSWASIGQTTSTSLSSREDAGSVNEYAVSAVGANSVESSLSSSISITGAKDTQNTTVPTAPTVEVNPGMFIVKWAGTNTSATPTTFPVDFRSVNVYAVSNGVTTLIDTMSLDKKQIQFSGGNPGSSWSFFLKSVDSSGNLSAQSASSPTVVKKSMLEDSGINEKINQVTQNISALETNTNQKLGETATKASQDLSALDTKLSNAFQSADSALKTSLESQISNIQSLASSKATIYYGNTPPSSPTVGDAWVDASDNKSLKRWNGTGWENISDSRIASAINSISDVKQLADTKVRTFAQPTAPTGLTQVDAGDIWLDTANNNKLNRWSGSAWVPLDDPRIAKISTDLSALQQTVSTQTTTYMQSTTPTAPKTGDLWFDTANGNQLKRWDSAKWVDINDADFTKALQDITNVSTQVDSKVRTFAQGTQPTGLLPKDAGDLWINTSDNNKLWRWNGTGWDDLHDKNIDAIRVLASGKSTTYYTGTAPVTANAGDLWINTNGNKLSRWDGTKWVPVDDTRIQSALTLAGDAKAVADGKINTFAQTTAPAGMTSADEGDIWIDTDDSNKMYRWGIKPGTTNTYEWVPIDDLRISQLVTDVKSAKDTANLALTSANGKNKIYRSTANPSGTSTTVGDIWYKFTDSNYSKVAQQWVWDGSAWKEAKLEHSTISSVDIGALSVIGQSTLSTVVANKIFTDIFAANKITAKEISVASGSLFPDPTFTASSGYNMWTAINNGIEKQGTGTQHGQYYDWLKISVTPNESYVFQGVRTTLSGAGGHSPMYFQMYSSDNKYLRVGTALTFAKDGLNENVWTVPSDVSWIKLGFYTETTVDTSTKIRLSDIRVTRQSEAVMIKDGAITANKIAANSITANKLVIGSFDNLAPNPGFEAVNPNSTSNTNSIIGWSINNNPSIVFRDDSVSRTFGLAALASRSSTETEVASSDEIPVTDSATYRFAVWFMAETGVTAGNVEIRFKYPSGTVVTKTIKSMPATTAPGTWVRISTELTMDPDDTGIKLSIVTRGITSGKTVWFDDVSLVRATDGQLLVDGAIDGKTITGAIVQTESTSNRGIKLTPTGLTSYDTTGNKVFEVDRLGNALFKGAVTVTGGSVPASTLTSGSIASGQAITTNPGTARVELSSAGLKAYNSSGTQTVAINSDGSAVFTGTIKATSGSSISGSAIEPNSIDPTKVVGLPEIKSTADSALSTANTASSTATTAQTAANTATNTANTAQSTATTAKTTADATKTLTDGWKTPGSTTIDGSKITANSIPEAQVIGLSTIKTVANDAKTAANAAKVLTDNWVFPGATTIDGGDIQTDTIRATQIAANAITAKHVITGAVFQTSPTANAGIKFDSTAFKSYNSVGSETFSINATTGDVAMTGGLLVGGTISGSLIQTSVNASTGIKLDTASLRAYANDANKTETFRLDAQTGQIQMVGGILSGGTITGSTFQTTSTPNQGIKISQTGLTAYNTAGSPTVSINSDGSATFTGVINATSASSIDGASIKDGSLPEIKIPLLNSWKMLNTTSIDGGKIYTGSVTADQIAARTIKASHMDFVSTDPISGGSMVLDSSGLRLQRDGSTIFQLTNKSVDTISLIGPDGTNVAGITNDGTVTGLTGTFDQVNVGGVNLNTIMDEQPRGIVARAVRTNAANVNPSTSNTHIQPVMRMEFPVRGGYTYEIRAEGLGVYMNNYTGTTAIFYMYSAGDDNIAAVGGTGTSIRNTALTPIRSSESGDTPPVSMVWHFTPSTDYVASILIAYSIWKGTEPVRINCTSSRPFTLTAREFERVTTTGKIDFLGTSSAGSTSTENVAAPRRETQTWTASAAASWSGSSAYSTDYAGSTNDLWQGYWSGSTNARRSHVNFNGLGDKGKSIASTRLKITSLEKLEVYLYNAFFYYYSGGKVRLHFHNSTTTGSYPSSTYIGDVSMGRGEGKWIEITNSTAKTAFLNGGFTGISLDPRGSTDQLYYGAFRGLNSGSQTPKLRATYLTT